MHKTQRKTRKLPETREAGREVGRGKLESQKMKMMMKMRKRKI